MFFSGALKSSVTTVLYVSAQRRIQCKQSDRLRSDFFRIGFFWSLQVGKWEMPCSENLWNYSFTIKGKAGRERRPSLSFLSRCHASIISSSSRLSKGVFLSLHGQARLPWWFSSKESTCQSRRRGFDLWVGKVPWRTKWQLIPVFLAGKSHGQSSLVGYNPHGYKNQTWLRK